MIDLSNYSDRLTATCQETFSLAVEETQRRGHFELTPLHLLFAILRSDGWILEALAKLLDNQSRILMLTLQQDLAGFTQGNEEAIRVSAETRTVLQIAWDQAQAEARTSVDTLDLLLALLESAAGQNFIRDCSKNDSSVETIASELATKQRDREKSLKKHFDLPPYLRQFSLNLSKMAAEGTLPPLIGRDNEIKQVIEILAHKGRSNSVILTGEAGVGKTAIAEGLAQFIEHNRQQLPSRLQNVQILNLQMNSLVAGTMFRGMFEDRIEKLIKELRTKNKYIAFIDEIHTIVGAGSAMGVTSDAANIMKSFLARGEIQVIGATTVSEYKRFISEDEALARRFRVVAVDEPSDADTYEILDGIRGDIERSYGVMIPDETLNTTITLSQRYNRGLRLPDKAIGWLHTASVRTELEADTDTVTPEKVMEIVAEDARIPKDMVLRRIQTRLKPMQAELAKRVIGQPEAIKQTVQRILLNKGPLKQNFERPDSVLMYLGPTGVGKTELAKAIAEFLFGDERKMIRVDMSEYQDGSLGVDKLIGMPRGIVGSDQGGILTNAVRENPCSVVLLDEIEKAHPLLLNMFLQIFDEGWITDGRGKRVYFSDTVIIMTSNLGREEFQKLVSPIGFAKENSGHTEVKKNVERAAENHFSPEFLNRIDEVVVFNPLSKEDVVQITESYLSQLQSYVAEQNKELIIDPQVIEHLATVGFSLKYGARFLKRRIDQEIKIPLTLEWDKADQFVATYEGDEIIVAPSIGVFDGVELV